MSSPSNMYGLIGLFGVGLFGAVLLLIQIRGHARLGTFRSDQNSVGWCSIHLPMFAVLPILAAAISVAIRSAPSSDVLWLSGWFAISVPLLAASIGLSLAVLRRNSAMPGRERMAISLGCLGMTILFVWLDRVSSLDAEVLFLGVSALIWFELPSPDQIRAVDARSDELTHAQSIELRANLLLVGYTMALLMAAASFFAASALATAAVAGPVLTLSAVLVLLIPVFSRSGPLAERYSAGACVSLIGIGPLLSLTGIGLAVAGRAAWGAVREARSLGDPSWLAWVAEALQSNPYVPALGQSATELALAIVLFIFVLAGPAQSDVTGADKSGATHRLIGVIGLLAAGGLLISRLMTLAGS